MAKYNWNPWEISRNMEENIARLINGPRRTMSCDCGERGFVWTPSADVLETDSGFIIQVELPGISLEQVNMEFKEGSLWIWGERHAPSEQAGHVYLSMECSHGPFARVFKLPSEADRESIQASYKDGLLTVSVKKKHALSRSIKVS